MKIVIIGNSRRFDILAGNLILKGFCVQHIKSAEALPKTLNCDLIVLPIPTHKGGQLNLEGADGLTADTLLEKASSNPLVIACNYDNPKYKTVDINKREDFAYLNAVPTAEGAIHAAVSNCGYSLCYGKILITGFGKVAKILADRLKGIKCDITVAARSLADLSYAKALGFKTVNINKISDFINEYDIIFQTVPSKILTARVLDRMQKSAIIIELSSASVGTDYDYAQKNDIKVVHAPALPEKIAPITAGRILTESVMSIIAEKM